MGGDIPGLVPFQLVVVQQDPHKLRHRQGGMGVVHVEDHLLRKPVDVLVGLHVLLYRPLEGGGHEEILLSETELLSGHVVVIGIEYVHDGLCQAGLLHRSLIVALIELLQLEGLDGLRIPYPQGVDHSIVIAHDGDIIGNGIYGLIALMDKVVPVSVPLYLHIASEADLAGILRPLDLEGVAVLQPVIRLLHLKTVLDLLLEESVLVTDAAAVGRIVQGGQGIQEAGCKPSQTAVAKGRIRLLVLQGVKVDVKLLQSLPDLLFLTEIDQIVAKGTALQKLHGQIVNDLCVLFLDLLVALDPVIDDPLLHHHGDSLEKLFLGGFVDLLAENVPDSVLHLGLKRGFVKLFFHLSLSYLFNSKGYLFTVDVPFLLIA